MAQILKKIPNLYKVNSCVPLVYDPDPITDFSFKFSPFKRKNPTAKQVGFLDFAR